MTQCSLKRCRLSSMDHVDPVFFPAPKDKKLYDQWIDAVGAANLINKRIDQLCSYHFRSSTFIVRNGKKRLNPGTIPTLNLGSLPKRGKTTAKKEDTLRSLSSIQPTTPNKLIPAILRKLPEYTVAKAQLETLQVKKKILPSVNILSVLNLNKTESKSTNVGIKEQFPKDILVDSTVGSKKGKPVLGTNKTQDDSKIIKATDDVQAKTSAMVKNIPRASLIDDSFSKCVRTSPEKLLQSSRKIELSKNSVTSTTTNVSVTQDSNVTRPSGAIEESNLNSFQTNDDGKNTSSPTEMTKKRKANEMDNEIEKLQKIPSKGSEQSSQTSTVKKPDIDSKTQKDLLGILRGGKPSKIMSFNQLPLHLQQIFATPATQSPVIKSGTLVAGPGGKLFVQLTGAQPPPCTSPTIQVQSVLTPKKDHPIILNSTIVMGPHPQHTIIASPKPNINVETPIIIDSLSSHPKNMEVTPGPMVKTVSSVQSIPKSVQTVQTPSRPIMKIVKLDKSVQVKMEDVAMTAARRKIAEQDTAIKTWRDNMAIVRKECENHKYYRELHSNELNVADVKLEEARTIIKRQQDKIIELEKKILRLQTTVTELQAPEKEEEPENPKIVYIYNKRKQLSRITYRKKKLFRKNYQH